MELGSKYRKVTEKSDSSSITKYGSMQEDVEFSCIGDLSTMVDDVLDWILLEKKELKRVIKFEAFWDAMIIEGCDYFIANPPFWANLKYKTLRQFERPGNQIIEIKGLEAIIVITEGYVLTESGDNLAAENADRVITG